MSDDVERLRRIALPRDVPVGHGWFKATWHLKCTCGFNLTQMVLPVPPAQLIITRLFVTVLPVGDGQLDLATMTDDPRNPDHLAFMSLILQSVADCANGELLVDDLPRHPILRFSARP